MLKKMKFDPSWNWGTVLLFVGLVFQTGILYSRVVSLENSTAMLRGEVAEFNQSNVAEHKVILQGLASAESTMRMHLRQTNGKLNN